MRTSRPFLGIALLLAACQTPPPQLSSTLEASTQLPATNPADVAVLPIVDLTPGQQARAVEDDLRQALVEALVQRKYSPLDPDHVDAVLAESGGRAEGVTNAAWLESVGGRFGEDAVLLVELTRWDTSSLMANGRVRFTVEAHLTEPGSGQVLWGGTLRGEVKAGGLGPAPRERAARERAAAEELARQMMRFLPQRRV